MWVRRHTEDYGIGRENLKFRMEFLKWMSIGLSRGLREGRTYIEEMKLINGTANAVCKEERIPF